jgi:hypothetical protein
MECPIVAATLTKSFWSNMEPRWIVTLDHDAAEIMGETKMRYVFHSENAAICFCETLQSNLDAAWDEAQ